MLNRVVKYVLANQVLSAILIVLFGWLLYEIRDVLIVLFISYILMAAISPYVDLLHRHGVPKPLAVLIPYIVAITFLVVIILSLLPFFITQIQSLIQKLPVYIQEESKLLQLNIDQAQINQFAADGIEQAFTVTSKVFGGIFSVVSVFVISFYLLVYKQTVRDNLASLFPPKDHEKVANTFDKVEDKLGSWLRGQVVLSGFIGITTWIVLTLLGVDYALPLAVIAGLLEIVPTIGPTLSAIPAIIVALNISLPLALVVALSYVLIQFFESHALVPRVMQKAVGLNPIIIILAIITGGKLFGPIGALLAVPFISLIVVIYRNLE